jgi:predicted TPR repeat methyltransferase
VLDVDPASVKALFRLGKCQLALDHWDAAKESFRKVLELDDGNVEARRGLQSVRAAEKAQKDKDKKLYAGKKLFDGKARPTKPAEKPERPGYTAEQSPDAPPPPPAAGQ